MKKILMLILPLLAFVGGAIGGDVLHAKKPDAEVAHTSDQDEASREGGTAQNTAGSAEEKHAAKDESEGDVDAWFKFPEQFFIPIIRNGTTGSVMVMSLSLEIPLSTSSSIEAKQNPLRDALLNALLIEANTGAFDGNYTTETNLERVRASLLTAAQRVSGADIRRVLIEDIAKQDQ